MCNFGGNSIHMKEASKKKQVNVNAELREGERAVTSEGLPIEDLINSAFTLEYTTTKKALKSGLLPSGCHVVPYIAHLREHGVNRRFCLTFSTVTRRSLHKFLLNPHEYVTIVDMMKVHSVTGITVGRQCQLLVSGFLLSDGYRDGPASRPEVRTLRDFHTTAQEYVNSGNS